MSGTDVENHGYANNAVGRPFYLDNHGIDNLSTVTYLVSR